VLRERNYISLGREVFYMVTKPQMNRLTRYSVNK